MKTIVSEETINGINAGEEKAFAVLYDCYFSYLCAYATTYVFDEEDAKDVVNELFASLWNQRGHLGWPIHNYLVRSVQNRCLNYLRALRIREQALDEYQEELLHFREEFCKSDDDPLQLLEVEELRQQVNMAVQSLPEKCRRVFELYLWHDLSPKEIAQELSLSVNTVRVHIMNAMNHIRQRLGYPAGILLLFLLKEGL